MIKPVQQWNLQTEVDTDMLIEKEQRIQELRETIEVLLYSMLDSRNENKKTRTTGGAQRLQNIGTHSQAPGTIQRHLVISFYKSFLFALHEFNYTPCIL